MQNTLKHCIYAVSEKFPKNLQIPKNIFFGKYYVTGQTFLASTGQIFLSSFHPIFSLFDPPFFFLFFSNFLSVSLIIGSTFMRLAECNLEIKRVLFSLVLLALNRIKMKEMERDGHRKTQIKWGFTLDFTKFSQRSRRVLLKRFCNSVLLRAASAMSPVSA